MCSKITISLLFVFAELSAQASFVKKIVQVCVKKGNQRFFCNKKSVDWLLYQERELVKCQDHIDFIRKDRSRYTCDVKRQIDLDYWQGYANDLREEIKELKNLLQQK